jgi:hypothetical protein
MKNISLPYIYPFIQFETFIAGKDLHFDLLAPDTV